MLASSGRSQLPQALSARAGSGNDGAITHHLVNESIVKLPDLQDPNGIAAYEELAEIVTSFLSCVPGCLDLFVAALLARGGEDAVLS